MTPSKGSPTGTISTGLVHEALEVAKARGLDVASVLDTAGIAGELLQAPRARVSAAAYAHLWAALADAMDDEFFGMDSHPMRRGSFRLMCQVVLQTRSLEHALHRMSAFLRCILDDLQLELGTEGRIAVLRVHEAGPPKRAFTYATVLILVHGLSSWLVRRHIPLLETAFRGPAPPEAEDYRTRFCAVARFASPTTRIAFDAAYLSIRPARTERALKTFLQGAPGNLLVRYRDEASLAEQLRRRLRRQQPGDWPHLEALASDMNLTAATMQRRLQGEGNSLQAVKDALRRDIAIDLLGASSLSVAEVAESAGFREVSAFHRAFKKWTGVSPGSYRSGANRP